MWPSPRIARDPHRNPFTPKTRRPQGPQLRCKWSEAEFAPHERRVYKKSMGAGSSFGSKGLPRPIPAEGLPRMIAAGKLQTLLGTTSTFCSRKAFNSTTNDMTTRWPFVFAAPLLNAK